MPGVTRLPEPSDNGVGLDVDEHSGEEDNGAGDELRGLQPLQRIVFRLRYIEYPPALHSGIEEIEGHSHQNDGEGHFAIAPDQCREDEGPLEIMQFEKQEECQTGNVAPPSGKPPEGQHCEENRGLHKNPAEPVVHSRSPFLRIELAIARIDEEEDYEHRHGSYRHCQQKNIKSAHNRPQIYEISVNYVLRADLLTIIMSLFTNKGYLPLTFTFLCDRRLFSALKPITWLSMEASILLVSLDSS